MRAFGGSSQQNPCGVLGRKDMNLDQEIRVDFHAVDRKHLVRRRDESLEVVGIEPQVDKPLGFVRQVITWLLWSFLGPIVLAGFLAGISQRLALWVWVLSALPLQIYAALACFGTVLAAVICTIVYLLLARQLYKMMNA